MELKRRAMPCWHTTSNQMRHKSADSNHQCQTTTIDDRRSHIGDVTTFARLDFIWFATLFSRVILRVLERLHEFRESSDWLLSHTIASSQVLVNRHRSIHLVILAWLVCLFTKNGWFNERMAHGCSLISYELCHSRLRLLKRSGDNDNEQNKISNNTYNLVLTIFFIA